MNLSGIAASANPIVGGLPSGKGVFPSTTGTHGAPQKSGFTDLIALFLGSFASTNAPADQSQASEILDGNDLDSNALDSKAAPLSTDAPDNKTASVSKHAPVRQGTPNPQAISYGLTPALALTIPLPQISAESPEMHASATAGSTPDQAKKSEAVEPAGAPNSEPKPAATKNTAPPAGTLSLLLPGMFGLPQGILPSIVPTPAASEQKQTQPGTASATPLLPAGNQAPQGSASAASAGPATIADRIPARQVVAPSAPVAFALRLKELGLATSGAATEKIDEAPSNGSLLRQANVTEPKPEQTGAQIQPSDSRTPEQLASTSSPAETRGTTAQDAADPNRQPRLDNPQNAGEKKSPSSEESSEQLRAATRSISESESQSLSQSAAAQRFLQPKQLDLSATRTDTLPTMVSPAPSSNPDNSHETPNAAPTPQPSLPHPEPASKPTFAAAQEIAIRLEHPDAAPVDLRMTERQGEVRVAVRTADAPLQTSLRQDLSTLVRNLEHAGFSATPEQQRWGSPAAAESAFSGNAFSNSYSSRDSQRRGQQQQHRNKGRRATHNSAELENAA